VIHCRVCIVTPYHNSRKIVQNTWLLTIDRLDKLDTYDRAEAAGMKTEIKMK